MFVEIIKAIFGAAMFINAALFVPQAIRILKTKDTKGLSLITFVGFCLIQSSGVAYGIVQNDWYVSLGFGVSLLCCGFVTLLIAIYRYR